jgi:hypothetical protein
MTTSRCDDVESRIKFDFLNSSVAKSSWHTRCVYLSIFLFLNVFRYSIVPAANNNSVDDFAKSTVVSLRWYASSLHSHTKKNWSIFNSLLSLLCSALTQWWWWRKGKNIRKFKNNKHLYIPDACLWRASDHKNRHCSWWQNM